jgi:phage shock protein C
VNMQRRLTRSNHRIIAGVCGGIAEYLGWSPFKVRLIYVIVSILSVAFPGLIVYIILWFLMPAKSPHDEAAELRSH